MEPFTMGLYLASTAISSYGKLSAAGAQARNDVAEGQNAMTEGDLSLKQAELYGLNSETAKSNVAVLSSQAEIAGMGEDFAYAKARLQKGRISEQGRVTLAAQRSEFASRNIDPAFGSPLVTQALTASRVAQDLDLTDAGAAVEAADARSRKAGILSQAAGAQGQVVSSLGAQLTSEIKAGSQYAKARSLFSRSSDDITAGVIGAATSLLSGGYNASKGGGFGGGGGNVGTIQVGGQNYVAFQ